MSLKNRIQNAIKAFNGNKSYLNFSSLSAHTYGGFTSNRDIQDSLYGYAQAYTYIWYIRACVDIYAQMAASVPSQVIFNDSPNRDNDEIVATSDDTRPSHRWYKAERDFRIDYGQLFMSSMVYQYMLYDMVFVEKLRNQFDYPAGMRVLNTLGMTVNRDYSEVTGEPIQSYTYSWYGKIATFTPDEIAYSHGFNPTDDLIGSSIIQSVIDKLNVDRNLDRFLRSFFINDARPSLVGSPTTDFLNMAGGLGGLTEEQISVLRKVLDDNHKGVSNFWRPLITNIPINWQQLDPPQLEKFNEVQKDIQTQVFGAFGVNPALVGLTEKTNYKEGLEIRAQFIQDRLRPVLLKMQDLINDELLPFVTSGNDSYRYEFDFSAYNLITEQDVLRNQMLDAQLQSGALLINDYLEKTDNEPIDAFNNMVMVDGVPVPLEHVGELWKYKFLVAPSVYNSELITGEPLPQPAPPENVIPTDNGGEPISDTPTDSQARFTPEPSIKNVPEKYSHIDFKPTDAMADNARRGLELRDEFNRGGTAVGVARARDIANRRNLSPDTVTRMYSFFARHADNRTDDWGNPSNPTNGYIAHLLWGGDEGQSWATARRNQMETADNNESEKSHVCDHDHAHDLDDMSFADYADKFYQPLPSKDDIANELESWRKFVNNGTYLKRAFVPVKSIGDIADDIQGAIDSNDDKSVILQAIDSAIEAIKAIQSTRVEYELAVEDLIEQSRNRDINKQQFRTRMMQNIRAYCVMAFIDGLRDGGILGLEPDDDERAIIERHVRNQRQYVNGLADTIYGDGISDTVAQGKPAIWYNKSVSPMYDAGKVSADKNGIYEWVYGDTEHCRDCQRLNGQRHRMKTYYARGIIPQSDLLECNGFNCKCNLIRVTGNARGRLPNL